MKQLLPQAVRASAALILRTSGSSAWYYHFCWGLKGPNPSRPT